MCTIGPCPGGCPPTAGPRGFRRSHAGRSPHVRLAADEQGAPAGDGHSPVPMSVRTALLFRTVQCPAQAGAQGLAVPRFDRMLRGTLSTLLSAPRRRFCSTTVHTQPPSSSTDGRRRLMYADVPGPPGPVGPGQRDPGPTHRRSSAQASSVESALHHRQVPAGEAPSGFSRSRLRGHQGTADNLLPGRNRAVLQSLQLCQAGLGVVRPIT